MNKAKKMRKRTKNKETSRQQQKVNKEQKTE